MAEERPLKRRKMMEGGERMLREEKEEEKEKEKKKEKGKEKEKKGKKEKKENQENKEKKEKKERKKEKIQPQLKKKYTQTISITFGDQDVQCVGVQGVERYGLSARTPCGFSEKDLVEAQKAFGEMGGTTEWIDLRERSGLKSIQQSADPAFVVVFRQGVNLLLKEEGKTADDFFDEVKGLDADKKAFMYGRMVNKMARHNLSFAENAREPDYSNKKGRITPFSLVPVLVRLRNSLPVLLGKDADKLVAEANYYYDVSKCGIGFHGDGERKKVVVVRLGASLPLHYQWFMEGEVVGERVKLVLHHGDMYAMSEKASGFDWVKKRKAYTLRHAAGCEKFLKIKGSIG